VGAGGDDAASVLVVVEKFVEVADATVVHVGGADGDVAQGRWAEFADVGGVMGEFGEALIVGGIGGWAGKVVEAVVSELDAVGFGIAWLVGLKDG